MNKKIFDIINNYESEERILLTKLHKEEGHPGIKGSYKEGVWQEFFERIIPKKFSIKRNVFIMDATSKISDEVDLAIFDETYTPYILKDKEYQYIPIEAVAAVVQCKSSDLRGTEEWSKSIEILRTSDGAIARVQGMVVTGLEKEGRPQTQTSTRPIKILCHTSCRKSGVDDFDLTIDAYGQKLTVYENPVFENLSCWYDELNHYKTNEDDELKKVKISDGNNLKESYLDDYKIEIMNREITIISLIFKLNQLLMLINNPLFFPHRAYVNMFEKGLEKLIEKEGSGEHATRG